MKFSAAVSLLLASRALQALGAPMVAFLIAHAPQWSGGLEDAVSFCNVLFVGDLCAALLAGLFLGPSTLPTRLRKLSPRDWLAVCAVGGLAALLSALFYTALTTVSVTDTVLLSRLGPLLYTIVAATALGRKLDAAEWFGFATVLFGLFFVLHGTSEATVGRGDILLVGASGVFVALAYVTRTILGNISATLLVMLRNLISSLLFFITAILFYGPEHFADAFRGQLWVLMIIYAMLVIVLGQYLWYRSVPNLEPALIAKWSALSPMMAVGYAFALNGEVPSLYQMGALGLVVAGMIIAGLGHVWVQRSEQKHPEPIAWMT